jgi:MFS family permease
MMSDLIDGGKEERTATILPASRAFERLVFRKVRLRLIPFLFVLYVVNILDRANVAFARLQMVEDLQMSEGVYALGASIFYIGYFLFEVPSNLIMRRTGARLWIGRIMISWGIISAAMMFIRGPWSFYLLRFLLGFAEAGFFPGIILYLTYWFPARERARAVALFMTGSAITGIFGNPISGAILDFMTDVAGLRGWQWLFLLEGIPAVILGFIVFGFLRDRPADAPWLTPQERSWLMERLSREEEHREQQHGLTLLRALGEPRVWLLCLLYFTVAMGSNGFGFYLPTIIDEKFKDLVPTIVDEYLKVYLPSFLHEYLEGRSKLVIGLLAAVPYLAAIVSMVLVGLHSDHTGERRWHVAVPAFVAAVGWVLSAYCQSPWLTLLALAVAAAGMYSMLAPFWSLPTSFLSGAAAAGGIALINSVGNLGGFIAPNVIGQVKEATNSFTGGMIAMAVVLFLGSVLALCVRHDPNLESSSTTK